MVMTEINYKGIKQNFVRIPRGEFLMGSPESEHSRWSDEQQREVILTRDFWMAETACTQALWQAVMGYNPSEFKGGDLPVDSVSWEDCLKFIEKINVGIPDLELCLPTEAQWEYACRAGTVTPFHFGETITTDQANFDGIFPYNKGPRGEFRGKTVPVKSFPCNDWGLYEMHGNVWEWCADWYGDAYYVHMPMDPQGPETGWGRVFRGGAWCYSARDCRSANRYRYRPGFRDADLGFRLVFN